MTPNKPDSSAQAQPTVDIQALADRVYRLMLAELRLNQTRAPGRGGRR